VAELLPSCRGERLVFVRGVGDENKKRARKKRLPRWQTLKICGREVFAAEEWKETLPRGCEVCFFRERHEVARFSVREW
jgi:hypothetical protein